MTQRATAADVDGGYNAIKGFAFQFDSTILEALADPTRSIGVERDQDIDIDNFHIQVKLRSGSFVPSAISKAIRQIIKQFKQNTNRRYRLYAHFEDRTAGDRLTLTLDDLTRALGEEASSYEDKIKDLFITQFEIVFAPDLEVQFTTLLKALREHHSLKTDEEAVVYHAVLHGYLTDLILRTPRSDRVVTAADLKKAVTNADQVIFQGGYSRHLGAERYLTLLKSQIRVRSVNVIPRQRLVVAEVEPDAHMQDIIDLADAVKERFYTRVSPQPYLYLRGLHDPTEIKRQLWDIGIRFTDGTHFNGDRFRIESLTGRTSDAIGLRLVDEHALDQLAGAVKIQEVYEFFLTSPLASIIPAARMRQMSVSTVNDAAKVMSVGGRR